MPPDNIDAEDTREFAALSALSHNHHPVDDMEPVNDGELLAEASEALRSILHFVAEPISVARAEGDHVRYDARRITGRVLAVMIALRFIDRNGPQMARTLGITRSAMHKHTKAFYAHFKFRHVGRRNK